MLSAVGMVLVPTLAAGQTLAGGNAHSVILASDGTVWTVGLNNQGQIGDNSTTTRKTPVQVSGLSGVVAVAAGAYHTLALTDTGVLYVWGDNAYGQIGDDSTTDRKTPVESSLTNVLAIAAGEYHSVALTSSGVAYTWGPQYQRPARQRLHDDVEGSRAGGHGRGRHRRGVRSHPLRQDRRHRLRDGPQQQRPIG
jgi:alpha-tubulin suppressor-like RCC1 family protein